MNNELLGMHMDGLVMFDLETSGLNHKENDIIQIAAIHCESGEEFECKMFFDMNRATEEALLINGYDEDIWDKEAVSQRRGLKLFTEFLERFKSVNKISKKGNNYKVAVLGGWNVNGFDRMFLSEWYSKHDKFFPADYRFYDMFPVAMVVYPYLEAYNLKSMNEFFELEEREWHDALEDVRASIDIASCIIHDIELEDDEPEWVTKNYINIESYWGEQENE